MARLELHHGPGFGDHGSRVAVLAHATARHLRLSQHEVGRLRFAALVHDVGKTSVDPVLLEKATELTDDESAIIRRHPQTGHDQLVGVAHPTVADAVLSHHERWDGRGFPNGLKKTEIPLYARIIFVADAYDVMTTGRSYRTPMTLTQAGEELARLSGQQFDPKVVDAFASVERRLLSTPTLHNATLLDVKMR